MKLKIELSRQGNFILAILLIHFVFFGYICNVHEKEIGERLLFLYQVLFDPRTIFSLIILFVIVFIMVVREKFFEYGIRNSIWLTLVVIIESWIWMCFIDGRIYFTFIGKFFTHYEGYLTLFSILCVNLLAAILGSIVKGQYEKYIQKIKKI